MKRFLKTVATLLICGALMAPAADAQTTRGRNTNTTQKPSPAQTRPSTSGTRPSTTPSQTVRPGNTGGSTTRPGGQPGIGSGTRPGGQQPGGQQPGMSNGTRPGQQPGGQQPGMGNRPGVQPGVPGGFVGNQPPAYHPAPPANRPPARPNMPYHPSVWTRPTPPPSWRPPVTWNPIRSILGIALGTAFNISVNSLINSGYTVTHYGNNNVFLSNVAMLNLRWPEAVLYYNGGGLCGSRFVYSTRFQDMTRYNTVYSTLVSMYGMPFSVENTASGIQSTWWGTGNQFITLSFGPEYLPTGIINYMTVLSFGN